MIVDTRVTYDLRLFVRSYNNLMRDLERAGLVDDLPLAQGRVLRELMLSGPQRSADLVRLLDMDSGQISRVVAGLKAKQLICVEVDPPSWVKVRKGRLILTEDGRRTAQAVMNRQMDKIYSVLSQMSDAEKERFFAAARDLGEHLYNLGPIEFEVRAAESADIGLLIDGIVLANTAANYQFNDRFAFHIVNQYAQFGASFEPDTHLLLVCERQSTMLGSIMMSPDDEAGDTAVIRQLWVAYGFDGHGIGTKLLHRCMKLAAEMGYRQIRADCLKSIFGRTFYARHGWRLGKSQQITLCGRSVVREQWSRSLKGVA